MALAMTAPEALTPDAIRLYVAKCGKPDWHASRPHLAQRSIARLVWELIENGPAEHKSGRATALIAERVGTRAPDFTRDQKSLSHLLAELDDVGLIARLCNAKRTFVIEAAVSAETMTAAGYPVRFCEWPKVKADPIPDVDWGEPANEPEPELAPPALAIVEHIEPDVDIRVADELLVETKTLNTAGYLIEAIRLVSLALCEAPNGGVDPLIAERLATTLEDNQRLRRKLAQTEDVVVALKQERDGVVRAKRVLEANLHNMAKGSFDPAAYRQFMELDREMRRPPSPAKAQ